MSWWCSGSLVGGNLADPGLVARGVAQAKHDANERSADVWGNVWQSISSSSEQSIRLYLKELVDAVCKAMAASSWAVRGQSARALAGTSTRTGWGLAYRVPFVGCGTCIPQQQVDHDVTWYGATPLSFRQR